MTHLLDKHGILLLLRQLMHEGTFRAWAGVLTLLLLVNLMSAILWTYPRLNAVGQARVEEERITAARERVIPALERARQRFGHVVDAETSLANLRKRIAAASGSTAEALGALRRAVVEAGLEVGRVAYQLEVIDELGLLELQATLPVTGSYASLRNLIFALGAEQVFTAIDSISLAATGQAGAADSLSIELSLSTFVADPEARPVGAAGNGAASGRQHRVSDELDDPEARVEEIRVRLASLPPLPRPADAYKVHLNRLDGVAPEARVSSRNLFAFESRPGSTTSSTPTQPPEQPTPTAGAGPPPPPRVAFKLIGIVDISSGRRATLVDGNGLYVVGAGEDLPDGSHVAAVGIDYVELEVRGILIRLTLETQSP